MGIDPWYPWNMVVQASIIDVNWPELIYKPMQHGQLSLTDLAIYGGPFYATNQFGF